MATSGQIQTNTAFGYVRLAWATSSQDVSKNTSTISYTLSIYRSSAISSTAAKDYSIKINGITVASGTNTIGGSGTKTLKTGTTTINHNSDGTKTFSLSFSQEIAITWSGSNIGTITGSGNGTLNTIPRATTPTLSASSVTMGEAITISTPRASSNFTHTLTYKIGSISGTIASNVATSYAWTTPLSLANGVPNATSGTVTITCNTYNGSTLIGTKTTTFKANVPSSVIPSGSVALSDGASLYATYGAYVQSKSKLKVVVTASGSYSSTIKSYKTTIEGVTYTSSNFTSNILSKSGTIVVTTIVTDSRGRTRTITNNITVLAYNSPKILGFTCERTLQDGTPNDDGQYLKATINFEISPLNNKNNKSYSLNYKLKSASTYERVENGSVYSMNGNVVSSSAILGLNSSYDIQLVVGDSFKSVYGYFEIGTAFTIMDFNSNGRAIAFGKVSEIEEGVEFGMRALFNNGEVPNGAIAIANSTDLNNLMGEGFYHIPDSSVSSSVLNKPYTDTSTSIIIVVNGGSAGQKCQICMKCNKNTGEIWERHYHSSSWGEWLCIRTEGKVLWSGGLHMTEVQTINLSERVSRQPNGIVLVFSRYSSNTAQNYHFNSFFIPKKLVALHGGVGSQFLISTDGLFSMMASKYLYIHDDRIVGHTNNDETGTGASGIKFENNGFVLRYVIGV